MIELPPGPQSDLAQTTTSVDGALSEIVLRDLEPVMSALGALIDRGTRQSESSGEPDGYDGISRDGDLDHLLASEWLLVGEEPDEFLRRYDRRELSYLRRRRARPRAAPTSLVVFDTGPGQLGRPRIAHIALLIVLARRASDGSVQLRWGSLSSAERKAVGARTVVDLIDARSASPHSEVDHIDLITDDALVVSTSRVPAARRLAIVECGDGLEATLIDQRTGATTRARVPLPANDASIRILRNPVGGGPTPTGQPSSSNLADGDRPTSNLVFDEQANKLLARSRDGRSLLLFPSPNSVNDRPGPVRVFEAPSQFPEIVAAGRYGRLVIALQIVGSEIFVSRQGRKVDWLPEGRVRTYDWTSPEASGALRLGRLWIEDRQIHADIGGQVLVGGKDGFVSTGPTEHAPRRWGSGFHGVVLQPLPWRVTHQDRTFDLNLDGVEVLGCGFRIGDGAGAVVVAADRRTIEFVGAHSRVAIAFSTGEIADAAAATSRSSVAVRTTTDDVLIWDWSTGQELYRWEPA